MGFPLVDHKGGRPRVRLGMAALLLIECLLSCAVVPAAGFWLSFGDAKLASITLTVGFSIACLAFGAIMGLSLRPPAGKRRAGGDFAA